MFGALCLAAAAVLLAACGSGNPGISAAPPSTVSPTTSEQPDITTTTVSSSPLTGHGLLTYGCGSNTLSLRSPSTGAVLAHVLVTQSFPSPSIGEVGIPYRTPCLFEEGAGSEDQSSVLSFREQFNSNFSLVAVISDDQPDGSSHVGYVSLATKHFTDVTAATASTAYGSTPPYDYAPEFDNNGDFYFLRRTSPTNASAMICAVHKYVPSSDTDSVLGDVSCTNTSELTAQNSVASAGWSVNPAGDLAASDGSGGINLSPVNGPLLGSTTSTTPNKAALNGALGGGTDDEVYGWVGNNKVLVGTDGGAFYVLVPVSASTNGPVTPESLLPSSQSKNSNAVVSADDSSIAFLALVGQTHTLYISQLTPTATPTQVMANFPDVLLGWQ
jgi:hypothetical protein